MRQHLTSLRVKYRKRKIILRALNGNEVQIKLENLNVVGEKKKTKKEQKENKYIEITKYYER